jgi:hypothetical protein
VPVIRTSRPTTPLAYSGAGKAVPISLANVIPVVEVTVAGKGPHHFAIDTGAMGYGAAGEVKAVRVARQNSGAVAASTSST